MTETAAQMSAIIANTFGGPDVLEWARVAEPEPGPGEVVLDVVATAVNRADLMQREGNYPPPPGASGILGLECSGRISALGPGVVGWELGKEVCALLSGGGYAEKVAVPAEQLLPIPSGISLADAAGLPEVACTVWSNLVDVARLQPGELVLIQGGTSGIGTHAIQVAVALGARVAATAGSPERMERCRQLGAEFVLDYRAPNIADQLREMSGRPGADVILDNMGAIALPDNIDRLAPGGRLVIIGMQGGVKADLDIGRLLGKRGSVIATSLRGRPLHGPAGKAQIVAAVAAHVWPMIEAGNVTPVIHTRVPMPEAAQAHRLFDDGGVIGKVILIRP